MLEGPIFEDIVSSVNVGSLVIGDTILTVIIGSLIDETITLIVDSSYPVIGATISTVDSNSLVTRPLALVSTVLSYQFCWFDYKNYLLYQTPKKLFYRIKSTLLQNKQNLD